MPGDFDIEPFLNWRDGLPWPEWDWIDLKFKPESEDRQHEFWMGVVRQWLVSLRDSHAGYTITESPRFLLLEAETRLAGFAEHCRSSIASRLPGVAEFPGPGPHVVLQFRDQDDYYRYVSRFTPEGEQGSSGGMQIREGYTHIAINGNVNGHAENTLAHEMTHLALQHLDMPQWIEEGLAQMMEHDLTGRQLLLVNQEMADRHKRHWGRNGLDQFWSGEGFYHMGRVQELSYQLAEILMRLLIEEHRPRWFGLSKSSQAKLAAFLREARREDAGAEACLRHLGRELNQVAALFLGDAARGG